MKIVRRVARWALYLFLGVHAFAALALLYLRFLPPLTTGVQTQRRVEAMLDGADYDKRYEFVPLERISDHLEHAVVAAEDMRFHQHNGFDFVELRKAWEEARRTGDGPRGASTITQQLVKNLFMTTHRSYLRKGFEITLTPLAEVILGKERILELYLNVVEWGRGVYGAEAAAARYYETSAGALSRQRAARLAALLPAPRERMPERMGWYSDLILGRMRTLGW